MFNMKESVISCGVYQIGDIMDYPCDKGICKIASERAAKLADIAKQSNADTTRWYGILGVPSEKKELETFKGQLKRQYEYVFPAMFVFSDAIKYLNGERLAKFIQDKNLGKVIESDACLNHNSGNPIKTWIWQVDKEATRNFVSTNMTKFADSELFGAEEYK